MAEEDWHAGFQRVMQAVAGLGGGVLLFAYGVSQVRKWRRGE